MNRKFQTIVLLVGAATLALATPALSAPKRGNGGGGRPAMNGGGGGGMGGGGRNVRAGSNSSVNRGGMNKGGMNNGGMNNGGRRGGNTNISGNTVVVNKGNNRGGGYNNGYHGGGGYYNNGHWDNDNDFGEFLGKTMAITAGAAIVTSIATSGGKTTQNGQECSQTISNGMAYVNCGGTWYAPVQNGTQTGYQAVPAPQ